MDEIDLSVSPLQFEVFEGYLKSNGSIVIDDNVVWEPVKEDTEVTV